jgi:hypothetical protein
MAPGPKPHPTSLSLNRKSLPVLDFRRNTQSRYGARPQSQKWLLRAALLLGVAVILIGWTQRPGVWQWLDRLVAPDNDGERNFDNRLKLDPLQQSADSFVIPNGAPPEKPADDRRFFPGVKPEWFESIRDNKPSSQEEQACTLALLNILQKTELDRLRKASTGKTTYAQLFRQPRQYRGQLVTLSGLVRAVHRFDLAPNEYGLKEYYRVWLYPFDNRTAPIVVYCLDLPNGFPKGDKLAEDSEVTGFFLKRWAYYNEDAIRVAPTLLAKTLEWQKRPVMPQDSSPNGAVVTWTVVVAVLLAMLSACFIYLRTKPPRSAAHQGPLDFDKLQRMDENRESHADSDQETV